MYKTSESTMKQSQFPGPPFASAQKSATVTRYDLPLSTMITSLSDLAFAGTKEGVVRLGKEVSGDIPKFDETYLWDVQALSVCKLLLASQEGMAFRHALPVHHTNWPGPLSLLLGTENGVYLYGAADIRNV